MRPLGSPGLLEIVSAFISEIMEIDGRWEENTPKIPLNGLVHSPTLLSSDIEGGISVVKGCQETL